jgi:hypothetical protein
MAASNERTLTVFSGSGFLGRRVVRYLRSHGFSMRIVSRHPNRGRGLIALDDPQLQSVAADIHDWRARSQFSETLSLFVSLSVNLCIRCISGKNAATNSSISSFIFHPVSHF